MTRASASQCIDSFTSDFNLVNGQESIMNKNGLTGSDDNTVEDKLDSIRDSVKGVVDRGAQKAEAIKHKVVEVKDQAMNRGSESLDRLASLVREHPLKAVGIAFGLGYIGMRL